MSRPQATARVARPGGSDGRRAELIEAARRVIQRRGFAKATVGAITGEAGASLGLLNYHFASQRRRRRRGVRGRRARGPRRAGGDLAPPRRSARAAGRLPRPRGLGRPRRVADVDRRLGRGGAHRAAARARSSSSSAAGAPCSPACWPTATASGCWRCAGSRGRRRAAGRRARRASACTRRCTPTTSRPRRRRAWARRLAELELGVTLPGAPRARARAAGADAPRGAHPDPRARPRRHRARAPRRAAHLRGRGARGVARRAPGRLDPVPRARGRARDGRLPPRARAPRRRGRGALRARRAGRRTGVRTRETIETVGGALVVSAGATVVADRRGRRAAAADRGRARGAAAMSARRYDRPRSPRDRRPDLRAGALERHRAGRR